MSPIVVMAIPSDLAERPTWTCLSRRIYPRHARLPGDLVDRLPAKDRTLLQAASVIGRRFKPELLAVVLSETEIDERLTAMQTLDLIRLDDRSSDYTFKRALVRDALYQSLLTERRQELHSKIAEEIERRSGNRLAEVAEVLAHHYAQTNHTAKAFVYLSMHGRQ
jgi:predicted ATPase